MYFLVIKDVIYSFLFHHYAVLYTGECVLGEDCIVHVFAVWFGDKRSSNREVKITCLFSVKCEIILTHKIKNINYRLLEHDKY
jgi:hypothetical protein